MKTILLPTDFSENARHAADYAFTLFQQAEAQFILLNSYETPHPTGVLINIDDILKRESLNELIKEENHLKTKWKGQPLQLTKLSQRGELSDALESAVRQKKPDLIVMGTQGASGLKEIFVGSNTAKVIKAALCPVLAIPENSPKVAPKKIVLAVDYPKLNDLSCLAPLRELAKLFNSTVLIVHVAADKEGKLTFNPVMEKLSLNDYFETINISYHQVKNDNIQDGLNDFIVENKADMLAMIPGRNNFFDTVFRKSVTNKMVLHTQIPLLTLRN